MLELTTIPANFKIDSKGVTDSNCQENLQMLDVDVVYIQLLLI